MLPLPVSSVCKCIPQYVNLPRKKREGNLTIEGKHFDRGVWGGGGGGSENKSALGGRPRAELGYVTHT